MKKDTLYIDIDDDITAIIDRVVSSREPITAVVLPKRAAMLHSSVNMRLLKRAADEADKRLVLITTEAPVLKLAALTRVHVAKSLTSKPVLPDKPKEEVLETVLGDEKDEAPKLDKKKSVGELAGDKVTKEEEQELGAVALADDVIELDNGEEILPTEEKAEKPTKKERKLMVPSFDKFRNKLFIFGGLGALLLVFLFLANFVWPKASIVIATERSDVETKLEFTANTAQQTLDEEKNIMPAQLREIKTTLTEKFTATGSKDVGNKATGTVKFINCSQSDKLGDIVRTVPAGTTISSGDKNFITTEAATVEPSSYVLGVCQSNKQSAATDVIAQNGGDVYNLSARDYGVSNFPTMVGKGSAMSGGTSKVIKVVSGQDLEDAKQKILASSSDEPKSQLAKQFTDANQFGLLETFTVTQGNATSSPGVDQEAGEATASLEFTYQMLGVGQAEIDKLIAKVQEAKIDNNKQKIYDSGLDEAKIGQLTRVSPTEAKMSLTATGSAGPQLDGEAIAREIAGKSGGETKQIIESRPGIASVEVRYDPFWVFKTPKKLSRITITFDATEE